MKDKMAWISSKTGKPVHLVDQSKIVDGDYVRICIDKKMAEQDIPIQVPLTFFIETSASEYIGLLKIWHDNVAAKKKHDDFFKVVTGEQKKLAVEEKKKEKATENAIKKAKEAFDAEMKKAKEYTGAKPKKIRKEPDEQ